MRIEDQPASFKAYCYVHDGFGDDDDDVVRRIIQEMLLMQRTCME